MSERGSIAPPPPSALADPFSSFNKRWLMPNSLPALLSTWLIFLYIAILFRNTSPRPLTLGGWQLFDKDSSSSNAEIDWSYV